MVQIRYRHTEQTDEMIRKSYADPAYGKKRSPAVKELCRRLNWPRSTIRLRALKLGVVPLKQRDPPWSDAETELLEKHAHKHPKNIAILFGKHGFSRTPAAISIRIVRHYGGSVQARIDNGFYSGNQVARLLGVDTRTLRRFVNKGWLPAARQGTARTAQQGGDHYVIEEKNVRRFIGEHAARLNFGRMDKFWLVDLLAPDLLGSGLRR